MRLEFSKWEIFWKRLDGLFLGINFPSNLQPQSPLKNGYRDTKLCEYIKSFLHCPFFKVCPQCSFGNGNIFFFFFPLLILRHHECRWLFMLQVLWPFYIKSEAHLLSGPYSLMGQYFMTLCQHRTAIILENLYLEPHAHVVVVPLFQYPLC